MTHDACRKRVLEGYQRGLREGEARAWEQILALLEERFGFAASSTDSAEAVPCQAAPRENATWKN